jgi:D-lactate dehydrogenase
LNVQMDFTNDRLNVHTARFAVGYDAVCLFVNDIADSETITVLSMCGVRLPVFHVQ